jgi:hypothetical protein
MPKPSDTIEITEDQTNKSHKVTLLIEEVEPVECNIFLIIFSDRPRKEGGSKGGFGTVKDELNKEKFEKPE